MNRHLHISPDLTLPPDAVTQTIVVFGAKGMGKTNLGSVIAEELSRCGLRFVVVDPVGVWWGLQHSPDGKGPGIDVLMLGGRRGDIPIVPTGGAVVADLVVNETVNVVVDISRQPDGKMWSKGQRVKFVTDFCVRLYERQGEDMRPLMLIMDEAARFIPQMMPKGAFDIAACVGAIESIVEEGRNIGLGTCLITQRSARMNKSVSELAACMIAFQTVGPNSVNAILDWFGEHVPKVRWNELVEIIRKLPRGQALVVSPGWLEYEAIARIRLRETYDSSSTPKLREGHQAPRKLTRSDLRKYQTRMADTIEQVKASDPRALNQIIAGLRRDLEAAKRAVPAPAAPPRAVPVRVKEVPILTDIQIKKLATVTDRWAAAQTAADTKAVAVFQALDTIRTALAKVQQGGNGQVPTVQETVYPHRSGDPALALKVRTLTPTAPPRLPDRPNPPTLRAAQAKAILGDSTGLDGLKSGERRIFEAVAAWHPKPVTRRQAALQAGIGNKSTISTYVNRLKAAGVILEGAGGLRLTDAGEATAQDLDLIGKIPSTTEDMVRYFSAMFKSGEARMLQVAVAHWPDAMTRDALAEESGIDNKSTMSTYVNRLRAAGLFTVAGSTVRASDELFPLAEAQR